MEQLIEEIKSCKKSELSNTMRKCIEIYSIPDETLANTLGISLTDLEEYAYEDREILNHKDFRKKLCKAVRLTLKTKEHFCYV